ncbi:hypothetical protein JW756_03300 [Candidatus Woesearchaeota archaeon]|nr:hypothetical protein [Candidatus Woesearchaeota archaeon]
MPKKKSNYGSVHCHSGSAVYGMGFIGAAVYYISASTSFWNALLGIIKALFWPAFLVFKLLGL